MNSQEARRLFKQAGLTYKCINLDDLKRLRDILKDEVSAATARKECDFNSMYVEEDFISYFKDEDKNLKFASFFISSNIFKRKSALTFFDDGHILFCGWTSEANRAPIIRGFEKWVKEIGREKDEGNRIEG